MAGELTPAQQAKLLRLREDFAYWAASAYTIIAKDGSHQKLVLNRAQQKLLDVISAQEAAGKPIRVVILKGRQQGMSTMIEAWQLFKVSQAKAKRAYVLAQDAEASSGLFEQAKRGYDNLPEILKPSSKRSNKKELVFGRLDSSLTVATAGGDNIGRSKTLQYVHASEVAFWLPSSAEKNWNGIYQCVPHTPDSAVFVESTANGMGGLYHRLWTTAERGEGEFEAVFVPWTWQDEYRRPVPQGFHRTPEEESLVRDHDIDDEQLCFRRERIAASSRDMFMQEYPLTAQEAFLTSGRPVFEPVIIHKMRGEAPGEIARMALEDGFFEHHSRGELHVWQEPDPAASYYIGADVAEGIRGGDFSVAQVLDGDMKQVAVWRGLCQPDDFALVLYTLGQLYNSALIAVEINNHGLSTANELTKRLSYPNVFTDRIYDEINDRETVRNGFTTNPKTRPLILNKLRAHVRDGTITINDDVTLKEMLSFVVTEAGRMEAEAGAHDDHVLSLAIAVHVNEGNWTPIKNDPSWQHEAI